MRFSPSVDQEPRPASTLPVLAAAALLALSNIQIVDRHDPSLQRGYCNPGISYPGSVDTLTAAKRCATEQTGRLALVNFALPQDKAEKLAENIEAGMAEVTHGVVQQDVVVVPATPATKEAYAAALGVTKCVTRNDYRTWASIIADQHMPELSAYEQIMSVSDKDICDDKAVAFANTGHSRGAEIFVPTDQSTYDPAVTTSLAMHENLHLLGLGHDGALYNDFGTYSESFTGIPGGTLQLKSYIHNNQALYFEYGGLSVMSNRSDSPDALKLNPVLQDVLTRPDQILKGSPPLGSDIGVEPQIFTLSDTGDMSYGYVDLAESVVHRTPEGQTDTRTRNYTRLTVVPKTSDDRIVTEAEIGLVTARGNYTSLGSLYGFSDITGTPTKYKIDTGTKVLSLTFDEPALSVQTRHAHDEKGRE